MTRKTYTQLHLAEEAERLAVEARARQSDELQDVTENSEVVLQQTDPKTGCFLKQLKVWTPDLWNEGWVNNDGRFMVYRPDCPRAYEGGYALRAHVNWWLHYGDAHQKGTNLHHLNNDRLDDRIENLKLMEHGEHTRMHCSKLGVELVCQHCGKIFYRPQGRINSRVKEGYAGVKFCSQHCYHAVGRQPDPESLRQQAIAAGLPYYVVQQRIARGWTVERALATQKLKPGGQQKGAQ